MRSDDYHDRLIRALETCEREQRVVCEDRRHPGRRRDRGGSSSVMPKGTASSDAARRRLSRKVL